MITQFIFQSMFLYPLLNFIIGRREQTKSAKLAYTVCFIFAVAAAMSVWRVSTWEQNYFQVLGVPRSADAREIKQAYRKLSIELHPDKNPSEAARERFLQVTHAQNALLNNETRDAYDRWGVEGLKWVETNQSVHAQGLMSFALLMFTEFVLVYILTAGVSSTNARSYAYGFLGLMAAGMAGMRFGDDDLPVPFAVSMTRNEKCELLRDTLGVFVLGISAWQRAMYFNWEEAMFARMREIEAQHHAILTRLNNGAGLPSRRPENAPPVPGVEAPQSRFRLPEIPSWAYLLLVFGVSHLMSGGKD